MAGGVLKGFGVVLIVLGSLGVLVGLAAALFGGYVANEEDQRLFGDRDKAEGGMALGVGGLALAGAGVVVLLLGIALYAWGAALARRELLKAVAAPRSVPVAPGAQTHEPWRPAPPPQPPAPLPARKRSGLDWRVPVGVLVAAAVIIALLSFVQPGGPAGAGSGEGSSLKTESFDGTFQDLRTPLDNRLSGDPQHEMRLDREGTMVVRASLNWTAAPGSDALVLVLEGQPQGGGGEWVVLGEAQGGPGLTVESSPTALQNLVRARISFPASGGAGSVDYTLTLTALAS